MTTETATNLVGDVLFARKEWLEKTATKWWRCRKPIFPPSMR
ncbi:MAG: hypothetical protein U0787_04535 [Polyangia bacterium]